MLSPQEASATVGPLLIEASKEWDRLQIFTDYHRGRHADPYKPRKATDEFIALRDRSRTNLIPLIVETLVDRLYVDGFRPDTDDEEVTDSVAWNWWQANSFDSRQKSVYTSTAKYGYSYVQVWPGEDGTPVFRPYSPTAWYARYAMPDDEWPSIAVRAGNGTAWLLDDEALYILDQTSKPKGKDDPGTYQLRSALEHGLGVTPLVRFMNSWPDDGEAAIGEIEPLIHIQDRLNQTVFDLLAAQTWYGTPQRIIAGVQDITPEEIERNKRLRDWVFNSAETKVSQLPGADLTNIVEALDNCLRIYGLRSQTPAHYLLGDIINLSAEALVAAEAQFSAKVEDRQSLHGESWEQVFRLGAVAAEDQDAAADISSQVVWRNTDPRSLASTVDALGKLTQMLQVPPDELWPLIPGVTQQTVARWRKRSLEADPLIELTRILDRDAA